jgi:hypothetical protein
MSDKEEDLIFLPLSHALECLWGYKDRVTLHSVKDKVLIEQLVIYKDSPLLFIQYLEKNIIVIWRKAEWEMEYQRFLLSKLQSEQRIEKWEGQKSIKVYIKGLILARLGEYAGASIAESLSEDIVKTKNEVMALMFGADKEKLKWD